MIKTHCKPHTIRRLVDLQQDRLPVHFEVVDGGGTTRFILLSPRKRQMLEERMIGQMIASAPASQPNLVMHLRESCSQNNETLQHEDNPLTNAGPQCVYPLFDAMLLCDPPGKYLESRTPPKSEGTQWTR